MLELLRYNSTPGLTQGILLNDGDYAADTLELPWKNNEPFISCIPEGVYALEWREDPNAHVKKGYVVKNVEGRAGILIHAGNHISEIQGCILVGVKNENALVFSEHTLKKLRESVGGTGVLRITGASNEL